MTADVKRFNPCETEQCKRECDSYAVRCEEICIDEIERLRTDAERLDWLEQHAWADEKECFDFVDGWRTPDGKRHETGLRAAIDSLMTSNVELTGAKRPVE